MTKVRGGEDIFVIIDEGENWEERDILVVIIESMKILMVVDMVSVLTIPQFSATMPVVTLY